MHTIANNSFALQQAQPYRNDSFQSFGNVGQSNIPTTAISTGNFNTGGFNNLGGTALSQSLSSIGGINHPDTQGYAAGGNATQMQSIQEQIQAERLRQSNANQAGESGFSLDDGIKLGGLAVDGFNAYLNFNAQRDQNRQFKQNFSANSIINNNKLLGLESNFNDRERHRALNTPGYKKQTLNFERIPN